MLPLFMSHLMLSNSSQTPLPQAPIPLSTLSSVFSANFTVVLHLFFFFKIFRKYNCSRYRI
ncbi:hypothetical protein HanIR_Chr10g0461171 [Helianthus annuus]|nr:hypothetical protein HanIR_Chr10g0461171 [Helianthus annuus]